MTTQFLQAIAGAGMALTIAATSPQTIAHIHGTIVKIDAKRSTFTIHHDPFPMMPMAMTMEVEPKRHADLRKLHAGEVIYATVDTSIVPWPGSDIRPDPKHERSK
jgi:Cu/Ag efflux protein CusF